MQVSRAAAIWLEYHRSHSRENTLKSYEAALAAFLAEFPEAKSEKFPPRKSSPS